MNSKYLTGIRNFKINFHQKKDKSLREQVIKKTLKPKKGTNKSHYQARRIER